MQNKSVTYWIIIRQKFLQLPVISREWEVWQSTLTRSPTTSFILITAAAAAKSLQSCPTLCDPIDGSPPGFPVPGVLQARVGCHFLLQCMKVKSGSEVAQSCTTLRDPMDCSLPGSSVHGIFQARVLEWGAIAFSDPDHSPFPPHTVPAYTVIPSLRFFIVLSPIQALLDIIA